MSSRRESRSGVHLRTVSRFGSSAGVPLRSKICSSSDENNRATRGARAGGGLPCPARKPRGYRPSIAFDYGQHLGYRLRIYENNYTPMTTFQFAYWSSCAHASDSSIIQRVCTRGPTVGDLSHLYARVGRPSLKGSFERNVIRPQN